MTNAIVQVNVSQTVAPAPITLQRTGAFISQGATNTALNTLSLLTQLADLTPLLTGSHAVTSITQTAGTATITTTTPHGVPIADVIPVTIAGASPAAYNGVHTCTATGASTLTFAIASGTTSPATGTIVYTLEDVAELLAMATTFFAQGTGVAVYVLELGIGDAGTGVAALTTYLTANPFTIYRFLVPRYWDVDTDFLALLTAQDGTTAKLYFHVTTTNATYASYTALQKSAMTWIEAPAIPAIEFSAAADFYVALNYNPSTTNKVPPNAFAFLAGVTPYPAKGNQALFAAWKLAGVNWVGTGAEGGISNAITYWGTMQDGHDLTYWYSVDWMQLHLNQDLANEIINGSNNPQAPLYYDQNGINRLQARAQATANQGVSIGLVLPPVVVTAVPFTTYTTANPSDYPVGTYNGLAVVYTPNRGFKSITFNVQVSNIPLA